MDASFLRDIIVIIGLSVAAVYLGRRLRVPSIVGFLVTGAAAGPHGLGLVGASEEVEALAEVGVVALLFTIGLEFSLGQLWRMGREILLGGTLQVFATATVGALLAMQFGQARNEAVLIGCLVALSSTAVVLGLLQRRAEINTPQGRVSLAVLIYQDVIVVAMLLLVPLLAGKGGPLGGLLLGLVAKTIVIGVAVVVLTRWAVPALLFRVTRAGERELFVLTVILIMLAVAWTTWKLGLSLALGAFLAGLIISESEHSHRALGNVMPFRDVFTSFFFVSVGMMLDVRYVFAAAPTVVAATAGVIALKSIIAAGTVLLLGYPPRIAIIAGLTLAQVGEFSFVLFQDAVNDGLLGDTARQLFLAVSVLSMILTPALITVAPRVAEAVGRRRVARWLERRTAPTTAELPEELQGHLIIAGFGFTGQNLARAARAAGIDYVVIELNPETVRHYARMGEPMLYGDATQAPVLEHAGMRCAGVIAVVISDATATLRVVEEARRLNPGGHVIARAHFVSELPDLVRVGANEVVAEEFEASIEIFARVLRAYLVAPEQVDELIAQVRADGYALLSQGDHPRLIRAPALADGRQHTVSALRVCPGSPLAGRSPGELELRSRYGVTLIAVQRGRQAIPNPPPDFVVQADDIVIVMGERPQLAEFAGVCQVA